VPTLINKWPSGSREVKKEKSLWTDKLTDNKQKAIRKAETPQVSK
jgi:hypothetical protein